MPNLYETLRRATPEQAEDLLNKVEALLEMAARPAPAGTSQGTQPAREQARAEFIEREVYGNNLGMLTGSPAYFDAVKKAETKWNEIQGQAQPLDYAATERSLSQAVARFEDAQRKLDFDTMYQAQAEIARYENQLATARSSAQQNEIQANWGEELSAIDHDIPLLVSEFERHQQQGNFAALEGIQKQIDDREQRKAAILGGRGSLTRWDAPGEIWEEEK